MDDDFRIPLHLLRLKENIPAGMDLYTMAALVPKLRKTGQDHPPILVDDLCPSCHSFRVQDGRHRFFSSVLAGRHDILGRWDPNGRPGREE